jgi:hypothetical protein
MARVGLIAMSLEELGRVAPRPGAEVVLGGVRYRVLCVTPPKGRPSPWGRKCDEARADKWKLLLRVSEAPAGGDESR